MKRSIEPGPETDAIIALPADWHGAGTLSDRALRYLDAVLAGLDSPRTVETGAGRSTLVFSWRSRAHTVFALDTGESVSKPLDSPLRGPASIFVVDGPTQKTLFDYVFQEPIDLALLDGPHGFPFTALEYFRLYTHIRAGGFLVVDDVQIRSVGDLYRFLRADDMWSLDRRVDNTAFFVRTNAPAIDPLSDSWWLQGYNRPGVLREFARRRAPQWVRRLGRRFVATIRFENRAELSRRKIRTSLEQARYAGPSTSARVGSAGPSAGMRHRPRRRASRTFQANARKTATTARGTFWGVRARFTIIPTDLYPTAHPKEVRF